MPSRNYIAFISYRHLPLEMDIAKKLHRRIERFVIPRALRKNEERTPGLVFRDQDELPISSNLSADIQNALDHSEFLIVICTPKTKESLWVQREVAYFLEHHDHDHVLAVLADGLPEEAFLPQLVEVRDENGTLIDRVEPLAANIVADSPRKRNELFATESLRILAALIGCPFDALYQREMRYRRRRALAAAGIVTAIAGIFIGMLANRNREIARQLQIAQINESEALAQLAAEKYENGQYREAVEDCLAALPSPESDRPYVALAQQTLGTILHPYAAGSLRMDTSIRQDTAVETLALSADGSRLATIDRYFILRIFDTFTGEQLWETPVGMTTYELNVFEWLPDSKTLFLADTGTHSCLADTENKTILWSQETETTLAADAEKGICLTALKEKDPDTYKTTQHLILRSIATQEEQASIRLPGDDRPDSAHCGALSVSGRYAAMCCVEDALNVGSIKVLVWDLEGQTLVELEGGSYDFGTKCKAVFAPDDSLVVVTDAYEVGGTVSRYCNNKCIWSTPTKSTQQYLTTFSGAYITFPEGTINRVLAGDDLVVYGGSDLWNGYDLETGEEVFSRSLHDPLVELMATEHNQYVLLLANGTITIGVDDGMLAEDMGLRYYNSGIALATGTTAGPDLEESVTAMVTERDPRQIVILRQSQNATAHLLNPAEDWDYDTLRLLSPGGELLVGYSYSYNVEGEENAIAASLWDLTTGERKAQWRIPELTYKTDRRLLAVTPDGKLLNGLQVLDLVDGSTWGMTADGALPEYTWDEAICGHYYDAENRRMLTGAVQGTKTAGLYEFTLWENGQTKIAAIPLDLRDDDSCELVPENSNNVISVGPTETFATIMNNNSGEMVNLLFSVEDGSATVLTESPGEQIAMASGHRWMAAVKDGIVLYDVSESGNIKTLRTMEDVYPAYLYQKLLFAADDRYLLAFADNGGLAVFDISTGKCAYSGTPASISFYADASYTVIHDPEENRLRIFYDSAHYSEGMLLELDLETMQMAGVSTGPIGLVEKTGELLVCPVWESPFLCDLEDGEELKERAKEYLGR